VRERPGWVGFPRLWRRRRRGGWKLLEGCGTRRGEGNRKDESSRVALCCAGCQFGFCSVPLSRGRVVHSLHLIGSLGRPHGGFFFSFAIPHSFEKNPMRCRNGRSIQFGQLLTPSTFFFFFFGSKRGARNAVSATNKVSV
jgi:hypothetical protein